MLGSPGGGGAPEELEGADIGRGVGKDPDARLLFRGPVGDEVSGLTDVSAVEGRAWEGNIAVEVSASVWFPRLDIGDERESDAHLSDIEEREIRKAGEKRPVCCARFWTRWSRVWIGRRRSSAYEAGRLGCRGIRYFWYLGSHVLWMG